jgi:hypothetical protein
VEVGAAGVLVVDMFDGYVSGQQQLQGGNVQIHKN